MVLGVSKILNATQWVLKIEQIHIEPCGSNKYLQLHQVYLTHLEFADIAIAIVSMSATYPL